MVRKLAFLCVLIAAQFHSSWQISLPTDPTYHAGVFEYAPSTEPNLRTVINEERKRVLGIIESNATADLDILIFPEFVLSKALETYVPDPALRIAPCDTPNYNYFFSEISCAARSAQLYVVINVAERAYCADRPKECNSNGINIYNTNVVFDRQGRVISRYRKVNLYRGEWKRISVPHKPDLATFTTDFGVTFGHFICFDMLFYEPAMQLLKEKNVTDIIYPTYWFSELPFLTAVQLQEGWAYANNVNLLAADGSMPDTSTTGSGIYAGKLGRLAAAIYEQPTTKLLKAHVPKHWHRNSYQLPPNLQPVFVPRLELPRLTKLSLMRDFNVDIFSTRLLTAEFGYIKETVCHGNFCCQFEVRRSLITQSNQHMAYRYRLAAYSGAQTTFQRTDYSDLSICALIACTDERQSSCGRIFPDDVLVGNKYYFNWVNISGNFRNADRRLIMPSSVDGEIMPVPAHMYEMNEVQRTNDTLVSLTLTSSKSDLLTFGLWANYYSSKKAYHNIDLHLSPAAKWPWNPLPAAQLKGSASLLMRQPLIVLILLAVMVGSLLRR